MSTVINMDNLKLLSHSAVQILRLCPRKFELDRLYKENKEESTVHTAFGSSLGAGIQKIIETGSLDAGIWEAFKHWNIPLDEEIAKSFKSFPNVVVNLHNFINDVLPFFGDWQLAYLKDGKPACELSFAIKLPRGYYYRGFIDGVLQNRVTKKYRVLELKTTGSKLVNEVSYANSFQGVGYSVVLDRIAEAGYSDYEVLYIVCKTYNGTYESYPFLKLLQHRMNWINDLLLVVEQIEMYKRVGRFSTNGDACRAFGHTCRFFEECGYANSSIFEGADIIFEDTFKPENFDFVFTIEELLSNQRVAG